MRKLLVIAVLTLAIALMSCAQAGKIQTTGWTAYSIAGEYVLYQADDPYKAPVTEMIITARGENTFLIRGKGQRWEGAGKIEGKQGYYDWRFDNGSSGRTTFVINPDGTLTGHVVGSGVDWKYLARRIP